MINQLFLGQLLIIESYDLIDLINCLNWSKLRVKIPPGEGKNNPRQEDKSYFLVNLGHFAKN